MNTPKKWSKSNAYEMLAKFYESRWLKVKIVKPLESSPSLEDNK